MNRFVKLSVAIVIFFAVDFAVGKLLKSGLDKGMGLSTHSQILIVGHSCLMMALDENEIEKSLGVSVFKHTRAGTSMVERKLMTEMYFNSENSDSLKLVIIGVDPFSFTMEGLSDNPHVLFYPWMDYKSVDSYIRQNTSDIDYFVHKFSKLTRFSDDLVKQSLRRVKADDRNYKTQKYTDKLFEQNSQKWNREIKFNRRLMKVFEDNMRMVTDRRIRVVLLQTPMLKRLIDPHMEEYLKLMAYFRNLEKIDTLIRFIDYRPDYQDEYSLFFDPIHLNVYGQKEITHRLIDNLYLTIISLSDECGLW